MKSCNECMLTQSVSLRTIFLISHEYLMKITYFSPQVAVCTHQVYAFSWTSEQNQN